MSQKILEIIKCHWDFEYLSHGDIKVKEVLKN